MARAVIVSHDGADIAFVPTRVDRSRIYGARKRVPLDAGGRACTKAALTADGSLLVGGMTSQAHFTPEGRWVARGEMVGLDEAGNTVESQPSTLGVSQSLEGPVQPSEVLSLDVDGVFLLEPELPDNPLVRKLTRGDVFRCAFNYAAGLEVETAYLVANDDGVFAIVGKPAAAAWVDEGEVFVAPEDEGDEESDDLDFEML